MHTPKQVNYLLGKLINQVKLLSNASLCTFVQFLELDCNQFTENENES